jgi:peroxiredoxin
MTTNLQINDSFPDFSLPDQQNEMIQLSQLTKSGLFERYLGFQEGSPLIVVFYRGFFCPRDQQQMRQLVEFQEEFTVNYARLVAVSADPPPVQAAFRAGLGAHWPFLSDEQRTVIKQINILDETEGEYAYCAQPYTFVLRPDLRIHAIYNGWFFVERPTLDELRSHLRAIMEQRADYRYEAYDTPEVRQVRIPQQEWSKGAPPLGANGLPVAQGIVRWFALRHCDDRRQASNDDGQHVMGHDLFRDALVSTAPLRCGTEDRPTDGLRRGFDGLHRPRNL